MSFVIFIICIIPMALKALNILVWNKRNFKRFKFLKKGILKKL